MAAQALYRRYRSQTFDELVGQEHIVQTLRNALAEGRLAHAYLFTGPRGVGKTSVARLLAKAVSCSAEPAAGPCGVCSMCTAIAEGRAVDVIEMDAASHTSVEDAREIIERVQFRPALGPYKVYIIDEAHMLSTAAFNALLKTLEEPPAHALFILATTEVHKVPATILSRCQRFTFNRHSIAAIGAHLRAIADQEGFTLEEGVIEAIGRAATGSLRDALSLLDQMMAYGNATITLEQVRGLLGATEMREVAVLIDALIAGEAAHALQAVAAVAERGADLRQFTRDLVDRLRILLVLKAANDHSLVDLSADELEVVFAQAAAAELPRLLHWARLFSELDHQLRISAFGQLPLELAVIEAMIHVPAQAPAAEPAAPRAVAPPMRPAVAPRGEAAPAQAPTPEPAVARRAAAPAALPTTEPAAMSAAPVEPVRAEPVEAPKPRVEAQAAERSVPLPDEAQLAQEFQAANADAATLEHVEAIWPEVVRDVRVYDKTLQALLNSGVRPVDVKENTVLLEVANEWLLSRLEKPQLRQIVERVVSKHMGGPYFISCTVETQQRESASVLREQIRSSRKDPLVKAAINIFDADIIRVETNEE